MNLPNYFLADLPADAVLTPGLVTEACCALRRNREQFLLGRPTAEIVAVLGQVARGWLTPGNHFRQLALELGPARTGFSRVTLERGLETFFREFTEDNFRALLEQDLGNARALDTFCKRPEGRRARARGPELLAHVAAGNLPCPAWLSLALGLLTRSAQFMKCASGAALLPRLFGHSIYETDRKLGACLEIAEWRGGDDALAAALFAEADCVTATGSDATLAAIRARLPVSTRFLGHGQRVSWGYVARGAAFDLPPETLARRFAEDIVMWDQAGCLSPQVIYVEESRELVAEQLGELLAGELERRRAEQPVGPIPPETAAAVASRRDLYAVRAAHSGDTRLWHSPDSTAWTVVYEADARFQSACGPRWIYVKPVRGVAEALQGCDAVRGRVSTVGLAAPAPRRVELAETLARWGVPRICPPGRMQAPPLTWQHDGRPALGELVTWTDWEEAT